MAKNKIHLPIGTLLQSPQHTYKIESVLGAGGFGITYKVSAEIKVGNIPVKTFFCVKEHYMADCCERENGSTIGVSRTLKGKYEESLADFKAEAYRLNGLSGKHKGIVRVNEVFAANNTVYYVMEFLNGQSVRSEVDMNGAYSEENALRIIKEVGSAVGFLHSQRITHLDIKPDNIMLHTYNQDDGAYPVLIDFGLAKHYDGKGSPTSTIRVQGCSDGFSPIEQYIKIDKFSPASDVYSLAATLFYMVTGKIPNIASEINQQYITDSLSGLVSKRTCEAIVKAMRSQKEERTQTVDDFLNDLSSITTSLPFGYKLQLDHSWYLLTSVKEKTADFIVYSARQISDPNVEVRGGNITLTKTFMIAEYFNPDKCKRNPDGKVVKKIPILASELDSALKSQCGSKYKCSPKMIGNGTFYSFCTEKSSWIKGWHCWLTAAVCCIAGYFIVDIPDVFYSRSETTSETTIGEVEELQDTTLVDDNNKQDEGEIAITTSNDSEKKAMLDDYLKKAEACCDKAEPKTGSKAMIQVLLDAKFFYYDKAKTLHKELYGTPFARNERIDRLVKREYDYWVNKGNKVGSSRKNYALKKAYYENAYRLVENKKVKTYINWLDQQLKKRKR